MARPRLSTESSVTEIGMPSPILAKHTVFLPMTPTVEAENSCQGTDRGVEWPESRVGFSGVIWEPGSFLM